MDGGDVGGKVRWRCGRLWHKGWAGGGAGGVVMVRKAREVVGVTRSFSSLFEIKVIMNGVLEFFRQYHLLKAVLSIRT